MQIEEKQPHPQHAAELNRTATGARNQSDQSRLSKFSGWERNPTRGSQCGASHACPPHGFKQEADSYVAEASHTSLIHRKMKPPNRGVACFPSMFVGTCSAKEQRPCTMQRNDAGGDQGNPPNRVEGEHCSAEQMANSENTPVVIGMNVQK